MQFTTVEDALTWAEQAFIDADLFYGHGTDNAWDEAIALTLHTLDLPIDSDAAILERSLSSAECEKLYQLFKCRINERIPVPYLTQQAWFCGLPFYVDERVIIPRSPLGELIMQQFTPWIEPNKVHKILDLCTGGACIAIACTYAFSEATIDALDISPDALTVANLNVQQYQLEQQVRLVQSDVFAALTNEQYDIIVSNPPYVNAIDFADMPTEFSQEPTLALASGVDGLDITREILANAAKYLTAQGILIVEVGNSAAALEKAFPDIPFTWLEFENGGDGVLLLTKSELDTMQHLFMIKE